MENQEKLLYPPRQSKEIKSFALPHERLQLDDKQKEALLAFERKLYEKIRALSDIEDDGAHTLYPDFFLGEEGKKILRKVYLPHSEVGENDFDLEDLDEDDVLKILSKVRMSEIGEEQRKEVASLSSRWAQEKFMDDFLSCSGDVSRIENPRRACFLEKPEGFLEEARRLREIKAHIKEEELSLKDKDDDFSQAKASVLGMYRRLVNLKLARRYASVWALSCKSQLNNLEKEIVSLFSLPKRRVGGDILGIERERLPRFIERIDHFLQGAGLEVGPNGLFVSVPQSLRDYALKLFTERNTSDDWEWANSIEVTPQEIKALADLALKVGGFEGWQAEVSETTRGGLKCVYKKGNEFVRKIKIPAGERRRLGETLVVIEHELSHALRAINRESLQGETFKIVSDMVSGRGGAVNEGVSKWVEDKAREEMFGFSQPAEPYYLLAIAKKAEGGSFKECFYVFLENYAGREMGLSISELLKKPDEFRRAFDYVYTRALRIFRRNTPLDDRSGYVEDTRQLKYLEGYMVVKNLDEMGLLKYAFVKGLDLYSLSELVRLGMIDISPVREPDFVVVRKIWPRLRRYLKDGKSLSEALGLLRVELAS